MTFFQSFPTLSLLLLALFIPNTIQQLSCNGPNVITTAEEASALGFMVCTSINGDLVIGDPSCGGACTVTSLFFLSRTIQEIAGSLIVRCCNSLTVISGWGVLHTIRGSLVVEDNARLSVIDSFPTLANLGGNLILRNNPALERMNMTSSASSVLTRVEGYLHIERNLQLANLEFLSTVTTIAGNQLLDRISFALLYNPKLNDLNWLRSLKSIHNGTVWIEGNTQLCYAGYPQWQLGAYKVRTQLQTADKGIDWRTFMVNQVPSDFTWLGMNIPYLVVKDNAPEGSCASAVCDSACMLEEGCFGPDRADLCGGTCRNDAIVNTCEVMMVTEAPEPMECVLWPPSGQILGLWIAIFVLVGVLVATVLAVLIVLFICCCKKCKCGGSEDKFSIMGFSNPSSSELDGAVAFTASQDKSSEGAVVLRNSSTFDQFSFSDNQGNAVPKQTQKSIRFSLVESGPPVNTYAINEEENQLEKTEEIKSLPSSILKKGTKDEPHSKGEKSDVTLDDPNADKDGWQAGKMTEDVDGVRDEKVTMKVKEERRPRKSSSNAKKKREDQPPDGRKGAAKVKQGETDKMREEETSVGLQSQVPDTGMQELSDEKEKLLPSLDSAPQKELLRSPSNVSEGGLTASAPTLDLSAPVSSETPQQEEENQESKETQEIPLNFPSSQIKRTKELGTASFGTVYIAEAKGLKSGEQKSSVVAKVLKATASRKERDNFLKPVAGMKSMKHDNIVGLVGVCQEPETAMLLLEYCHEGPVKTFLIANRSEFPMLKAEGVIHSIACDIAKGLQYLHSINIAHNDLACRNCLLTYTLSAKIGDYGLSKENFKEDYYSRARGQKTLPIRWMAPELINTDRDDVIKSLPPSFKGNMWSLGVTLWELCSCCQWPYEDMMNEEVIQYVKTNEGNVLDNPVEEGDTLFPMYSVMTKCWVAPRDRPTATELVNMLTKLAAEKRKTSKPAATSQMSKAKTKKESSKKPESQRVASEAKKDAKPLQTVPDVGGDKGGDLPVAEKKDKQMKPNPTTPAPDVPPQSKEKESLSKPVETSQHTAEKKTKVQDSAKQPSSEPKKSKSLSRQKKSSSVEEAQGKHKKNRSGSKSTSKQDKKSPVGQGGEDRQKPKTSSGYGKPKPSRDSYYGYGGDNDDDDDDDPPQVVYDEDIAALIW